MRNRPLGADPGRTPVLTRASFADSGLDVAVDALNRGFADYVVPMRWTIDALQRRMDAESVDPADSFVYRAQHVLAGACMMARRGRHSRIAAFCVSPSLRKGGVGRRMLADALDAARARGDERTSLEVIEQNGAAVAFYRALGLTAQRRLYGYRRPARMGSAPDLRDVPIATVAEVAARYDGPGAQWQLAAETLRNLRAPARGYALEEHAFALVSGERDDAFDLRALVVPPTQRRSGWGRRMVDALAARHSGKACNVAPIVPADLQPFFTATGFAVQDITQLEMGIALSRG